MMHSDMNKARPKNLDLFHIRLPLPALLSILHRLSGVILFLALPVLIWALQESLATPDSFSRVRRALSSGPATVFTLALVWAYLHHFFAGIRHLFLDLDCGTRLPTARLTSKLVLGLSITLTVLAGLQLW